MSDPFNYETSLGYLSLTTNRLMSAHFKKQLDKAGFDLTTEQWGVLVHLWHNEGLTQDELAYSLCVEKSSLSRVLDVMERKGLVERRRDANDARRKILFSTEKGEAMHVPSRNVALKNIAWMLSHVSNEDLEACIRVLQQVQKNIREGEEASSCKKIVRRKK